MKILVNFLIILILSIQFLYSQLKPWDAVKLMKRGINIGNSLDATGGKTSEEAETSWGNPKIFEAQFDDYKNAGFTAIRIPITWGLTFRTSTIPPYSIELSFLNRVEQIVDWALSRGFLVIINAHHETWLKENFNENNLARFDSIWAQISRRFKDKSDCLLFEIINEPYPMSLNNVNKLNFQILNTIRKTNPTRIVVFSGHMWSNADELIAAEIPQDSMIIGYYHSYDPYPFGLEGTGTFGSDADINNLKNRFKKVTDWSKQNDIPVILSEFGATRKAEYNARMCYYGTVVSMAQEYGVPFFVWDDGGDFQVYYRYSRVWNEIKDILIHTYPQSPNKLIIGNYADTLIQLQWKNKAEYTDSIIIERKVNTENFKFYKKVAPNATGFVDINVNTNNNFYYYRLRAKVNDTLEVWSYPIRIQNKKIVRAPYNGIPIEIPGTLEIENFDYGVEGQSYHDTDVENTGYQYRIGPGVDIYRGYFLSYYVSNVKQGEWLEYTVRVKQKGVYKIDVYVSSVVGGGKFSLFFNNSKKLTFDVPSTGDIFNFVKIDKEVTLDSGEQIIRLYIDEEPDFGIDKIIISLITSIKESSNNIDYKIIPNPVKDFFRVDGIEQKSTIQIYDLRGICVKEVAEYLSDQLLDLSELPKSLYFIKCKSLDKVKFLKIIKE